MKTLIVLATLASAGLVLPFFGGQKISARGRSPESQRRRLAQDARIERALTSLRRGDASQRAEVRAVIAALRPGDHRRPAFAALLAERGETRAAFELERMRVHFLERSVPDDGEMAFYAKISEKAGRPDEAAWAKERMGADGRFRVWRRGQEQRFAHERTLPAPLRDRYRDHVDRAMEYGLSLHPKFRNEIEAFRRRLLAEAPDSVIASRP